MSRSLFLLGHHSRFELGARKQNPVLPLGECFAILRVLYYGDLYLLAWQDTTIGGMHIPRPKIDELARQAQGEGIFATGEYLGDASRKKHICNADVLFSTKFACGE